MFFVLYIKQTQPVYKSTKILSALLPRNIALKGKIFMLITWFCFTLHHPFFHLHLSCLTIFIIFKRKNGISVKRENTARLDFCLLWRNCFSLLKFIVRQWFSICILFFNVLKQSLQLNIYCWICALLKFRTVDSVCL